MISHIRSVAALRAPVACAILLVAAACGGGDSTPTSPTVNVPFSRTDLRVGTGAEATAGRRVTVNYAGWLYLAGAVDNKGRTVDSGTFSFTIGAREVIPGFEQGVTGMRAGGVRRIIIPPDLGYGAEGSGNAIPPNATLIFDVELTGVS